MDKEHRMLEARILQRQGKTQTEIASALGVCERTVRNHLKNKPEKKKQPRRSSRVDPHKPLIESILEKDSSYNGELIFERIDFAPFQVCLIALIMLLTGCDVTTTSPTSTSITPISIPSSGELYDVPYGTDTLQKMDIFFPSTNQPKHGVILMVHGGGWIVGDKADVKDLAKAMAQQGYVTIAPNYRLATFPNGPVYSRNFTVTDMLDDIDLVKTIIAQQQGYWNCDAAKIALVGFSAGAHLSLLQSLTRNSSGSIKCCTSFAGPVDLTDHVLHSNTIGSFSGEQVVGFALGTTWNASDNAVVAAFKDKSPLYRIQSSSVSYLLVHGTADMIVPSAQGTAFKTALENASIPVTLIIEPGGGHNLSGVMLTVIINNLLPLLTQTIAY